MRGFQQDDKNLNPEGIDRNRSERTDLRSFSPVDSNDLGDQSDKEDGGHRRNQDDSTVCSWMDT